MWESNLPIAITLISAAALLGFVLFWMLICVAMSAAGGWRRLGKDYPLTTLPPSDVVSWQSAGFGHVSYRNLLTVGALPEGLYLAVMPLFFAGHPALMVPWTAISGYRERRILFIDAVDFQIASSNGPVRVQLLKSLAEQLALSGWIASAGHPGHD